MKLYIDMIAFYLQKAGGITSVWKELIIRMLRDKEDIVLILQDKECQNIYFKQIMAFRPNVIYESGKRINTSRYMPVNCKFGKDSGFISTYYRYAKDKYVKQFVLVHDFTYEYYVQGLKKWVHSFQKRLAVKKADVTICVSKTTQTDMLHFYPWARDKENYVIYNGANEIYRRKENIGKMECLGKYNDIPFLLYVGSRAKYKRFDFAVDVATTCAYPLVIIGGGEFNTYEKEMLGSNLKENYLHLTGISDETLNDIYNKAFALIYPSEYEGFGIPIIEAQRAGCPVIAFGCAAVSEVIGNSETVIYQYDIEEVKDILKKLYEAASRNQIVDSGNENAQRFSWEKTYCMYREKVFENTR